MISNGGRGDESREDKGELKNKERAPLLPADGKCHELSGIVINHVHQHSKKVKTKRIKTIFPCNNVAMGKNSLKRMSIVKSGLITAS